MERYNRITKTYIEKLVKIKNALLGNRKMAIAAIIIILIIGFFGFRAIRGDQQRPQYQTAQAERGSLIISVSASGTISSGNTAAITTQATGIVNEVYVANGDTVTAGQNIATITLDRTSQQKQAAAYASYLSAVNTLNTAKSKMNSLQSALFKANQAFIKDKGSNTNPSDADKADPQYIIENADWLQAEADYNNQTGVISAAQAALSSASLSLAQVSNIITAPISGTVSNLTLTPGLPLSGSTTTSASENGSSTGTNSQSVGSITLEGGSLQAEVALSEIDIPQIKVGQKVTMTLDAFLGKTFTGKVASIDTKGSVSSGVTSYPVVITFDSAPDNIYPNMVVNATIITNVKDNVILVPSSAVQATQGETTVRVLRNAAVTQVQVEVGDSNDTQTEITSRINEGDTVVTGQTGGTQSRTGTQGTSPFGAFGGGRGFGGGGFRGGGGGDQH